MYVIKKRGGLKLEIPDFILMDEKEYPVCFKGPFVDVLLIHKLSLLYENVRLTIIKNVRGYFFLGALANKESLLLSKICKLPKTLGRKAESLLEKIRDGYDYIETMRRRRTEREKMLDYDWDFYMGSDDHWHYDDRLPSLEAFAAEEEEYDKAFNLDLIERYVCFREILQYFNPVLVEAIRRKTTSDKDNAKIPPALVYKISERVLGDDYLPNIEHFRFIELRSKVII